MSLSFVLPHKLYKVSRCAYAQSLGITKILCFDCRNLTNLSQKRLNNKIKLRESRVYQTHHACYKGLRKYKE